MLRIDSRCGLGGGGPYLYGERPACQRRVTRLPAFRQRRCGRCRRLPGGSADDSTAMPRCCEGRRQSEAGPLDLQKHMHGLLVQLIPASGECNPRNMHSAPPLRGARLYRRTCARNAMSVC